MRWRSKHTVLIAVLDEYPQFLHTELHRGCGARHAAADADQHRYHCVDALVQQGHSRCAGQRENNAIVIALLLH